MYEKKILISFRSCSFKNFLGIVNGITLKLNIFLTQCLQSLEAMKLVKKSDFRGRVVTPAGQRDMDRVAAMIYAPAAAPVAAEE